MGKGYSRLHPAMTDICIRCGGGNTYGGSEPSAGGNPDRRHLAVSWSLRTRPRDPDLVEQPGQPRRHDGGDRGSAAVDLACRTRRQADRCVDRYQPPRCATQRRRPSGRALDAPLRAAMLVAATDARRRPSNRRIGCCASSPGWTAPRSRLLLGSPCVGCAVNFRPAYDWVRGIPLLDRRVRESTRRRNEEQRKGRFESAYCAETVAVTYEEMGLIETEKRSNWFDPGQVLER